MIFCHYESVLFLTVSHSFFFCFHWPFYNLRPKSFWRVSWVWYKDAEVSKVQPLQLQKLRCTLIFILKQCGNYVSDSSLWSLLLCASEIKKIKLLILRCAFSGWKNRCALLRCAFDILLFVPTSGRMTIFLSLKMTQFSKYCNQRANLA